MRVATDKLGVDAGGDVGQGEQALLLGHGAVQHDLEQQVAKLFAQVFDCVIVVYVEASEHLRDLAGLFEDVGDERLVRLAGVPRAALAQGSHRRPQLLELDANRSREDGDPQRREMIGDDRAVEVGPVDLDDDLVGQAKPLHDRHPGIAGFFDGQLDG